MKNEALHTKCQYVALNKHYQAVIFDMWSRFHMWNYILSTQFALKHLLFDCLV